jgi:hypothetical protein
MKVYTAWRGSYSDRGMEAVFSTKESADEFLRIKRLVEGEDWDDECIEWTVDDVQVAAPAKVNFMVSRWPTDKNWKIYPSGEGTQEYCRIDKYSTFISVIVAFSEDSGRMRKSAMDRAMALYEREIQAQAPLNEVLEKLKKI